MDKIKSLLSPGASKDDEAMYNTPDKTETAGATGKVTGQGSHFGSIDPPVTPSAVAETPASVTTTTATETAPVTSSEPATEHSGKAAIGETSTYSSTPISPGDGTSSVVDPNSSDPTTFKKPEVSSSSGVLPGAAEVAAAAAFNKGKDPASEMPGAFPATTSTNPYANTNIDPRVDSVGHRPVTNTETSHTTRDTALGTVSAGAASTAAYEAVKPEETPSAAPAPATTTAAHPDSAVEEEPEKEKTSLKTKVLGALGIGAAGAAAKERKASSSSAAESGIPSGKPPSHHRKESIPTTAYPSGTFDSPRAIHPPVGGTTDLGGRHASVAEIEDRARRDSRQMQASAAYAGGPEAFAARDNSQARKASQVAPVEKESHTVRDVALGAGALGATGLAAEELGGRHKSVAEINEQTRRDSQIMQASAAYAGGPEAYDNRSHSQARKAEGESHLGRDATVGAGALGATGLAAHGYEKSREPEPKTAQHGLGSTAHDLTTTEPVATRATGAVATQPMTEKGNEKEESHLGRDAALGGAAVVGGGALAEHEHHKDETERAEKEREAAAAATAKEHEKEMKAQHKAQEKEEKKAAKQEAKEEKAQEKAAAKEAKKEEKEAKKEEKAAAKEAKKEEKEAKKEEKEEEKEKEKHEKEAAAAAVGTAAVGAGAYEAEKHHKEDEAEKHPETAATAEDPEVVKQREKEQKEAEVLALQESRKREYEEKKAGFQKDQEERVQARIAEEEEKLGLSHGEEGAAAGIGAGAIGAGAYEAEKHHKETETPTTTQTGEVAPTTAAAEQHDAETGHEVPSGGHSGTSGLTGLAAADAVDREQYGRNKLHKEQKTKKPGFFRRIFKRRKNQDTGDSEDYSTDEEHDGTETETHAHHAETATATKAEKYEHPTEAATRTAQEPEIDEAKYALTGHPKSGEDEA